MTEVSINKQARLSEHLTSSSVAALGHSSELDGSHLTPHFTLAEMRIFVGFVVGWKCCATSGTVAMARAMTPSSSTVAFSLLSHACSFLPFRFYLSL